MNHNFEVLVAGDEVEINAKVMTEYQARVILEHILKNAQLKNIVFSCKRVTPEPFSEINAVNGLYQTQTAFTTDFGAANNV